MIKNLKLKKTKNSKTHLPLKILNFGLSFIFGFYFFVFKIKSVSAQVTTDIKAEIEKQNFFQTQVGVFLSRGIEAAILAGGLAALGFILWGGLSWLTSGGDKSKYEAGRNKIIHAIIGLIILASVWVIWRLMLGFLGLAKFFP